MQDSNVLHLHIAAFFLTLKLCSQAESFRFDYKELYKDFILPCIKS
jgi:hypothetical protein